MLPICTQVSSYYTCCNYHHRLCNIRYMFNLLVILRLVATGLLSQYTQQTAPTADRTGSNGGSTVHLSPSKGGPKVPLQHLEQTALFPNYRVNGSYKSVYSVKCSTKVTAFMLKLSLISARLVYLKSELARQLWSKLVMVAKIPPVTIHTSPPLIRRVYHKFIDRELVMCNIYRIS